MIREQRKSDPLRVLGQWGEYEVRRFRPAHVAILEERQHDEKPASAPSGRPTGITIFRGAAIVACAGIRPLWPGVGEGWVLTGALVHECPDVFTEIILRGLRWLERNQGYHRIGAHVRCSFPAAAKWAEALGFKYEGLAPAFGIDGGDYLHYGRVSR